MEGIASTREAYDAMIISNIGSIKSIHIAPRCVAWLAVELSSYFMSTEA